MIRRIINIDEEKCNGCGLCATACHEGAIKIIDGKAKLIRDDYCDGLGDCLPTCPTKAITFIEREALSYDEKAVLKNKKKLNNVSSCKSSTPFSIKSSPLIASNLKSNEISISHLNQWPCQIKLAPINAPYFDNASLLIAADCTAFSYGNFHNQFMKNKITLVGCTKLDNVDYSEKLSEIIKNNNIKDISIVRMNVPCCRGIEIAVKNAIEKSGKNLPININVISTNGEILK